MEGFLFPLGSIVELNPTRAEHRGVRCRVTGHVLSEGAGGCVERSYMLMSLSIGTGGIVNHHVGEACLVLPGDSSRPD